MNALATVWALLPDGIDLDTEEGFVQAGQMLVDIGRQVFIGLGELLAWKIDREQARDMASQEMLLTRYAAAWGVRRSSLIKALVNVTKFPEVPRPEDQVPTATYEVLSGSDTPEEAEAGLQALCENGWTVRHVREAKALKRQGLTVWRIPRLFYRDEALWTVDEAGHSVVVLMRPPQTRGNTDVDAAVQLVRYRTGT